MTGDFNGTRNKQGIYHVAWGMSSLSTDKPLSGGYHFLWGLLSTSGLLMQYIYDNS